MAVIVYSEIYVPYDIRKQFLRLNFSQKHLSELHEDTVRRYIKDIDLISFAYGELYSPCDTREKTENLFQIRSFKGKY